VRKAVITIDRGEDLRGQDLSGADLRNAGMEDSDLSGANMANLKAQSVAICAARSSGATLTNADLSDEPPVPILKARTPRGEPGPI
jgi:uncharacterized protein YjbI with pentapeptide repeats